MRIRIIGAGVAGLSFALAVTAAGYRDVIILEEHPTIGTPKHCTGLVSETTAKIWGSIANSCIINKFHEYVVRNAEKHNVIYLRLSEPAYLLNRVKFEKELADAVLSAGGTIRLKHKVRTINPYHNIIVNHVGNQTEYDIAIVCEGASRVLARNLGLYKKVRNLVGIQRLILLNKSPETVVVYVDRKISHRFFGWCVPFTDKIALVGAADECSTNAYAGVLRILRILQREGHYTREVLEQFGGLIPVDIPPSEVSVNNTLLFGDAASLVKPLTGGGLYAISRVFRILSDTLKQTNPDILLHVFTTSINMFKRKFKHHSILRNTIITLGGYGTLLKILSLIGVHSIKIGKYDDLLTSIKLSSRDVS